MAFVAFYIGLHTLADVLGVPTHNDFGEEIDGEIVDVDVGFYIQIASVMLAWRIYHWVVSGKPGGNLKREHRITWFHWFAGSTAYIFITTPIWHIDIPSILQKLLVLGIGIGIAAFFYNKHQKAIYEAWDQ